MNPTQVPRGSSFPKLRLPTRSDVTVKSPPISGAVASRLGAVAVSLAALSDGDAAGTIHDQREQFDKALRKIVAIAASPDVLKKCVSVLTETTAHLVGLPWAAAKTIGYVAGKLAEPSTKDLVQTPDQVRAASMDAFLIFDSAHCARHNDLASCSSVRILVDKHGDKTLEHKLDALVAKLAVPGREFAPQVVSDTDSPSPYVGGEEEQKSKPPADTVPAANPLDHVADTRPLPPRADSPATAIASHVDSPLGDARPPSDTAGARRPNPKQPAAAPSKAAPSRPDRPRRGWTPFAPQNDDHNALAAPTPHSTSTPHDGSTTTVEVPVTVVRDAVEVLDKGDWRTDEGCALAQTTRAALSDRIRPPG